MIIYKHAFNVIVIDIAIIELFVSNYVQIFNLEFFNNIIVNG